MNNKPYSIASVILNYNDASTTLSLVRHIVDFAELDYIVVVDNDSSDDSWNRLSLLKNEKVHLLQAGKNGGYGAGNNVGIKYAKEKLNADYVLILNPDVIVEEECIAKLAETLHEKQDVAVVSAKQSNSPDCAWKNCNALQYVLATSLFFEILLKIRCYSPKYFGNENFVEVFAVPGSLLMVDADKMVQFGMYDEDFFLYYEEFVLAQKFANAGLKTILRLDCSYVHNHHVSISKTYKRWSEQHKILLKSAELFLRKYKKVNGIQMAFAKVWFAYTRLEFALYDLYRIMRPKR
ncbi:MAG: glycosyltransferase family 2 protein [Fibrobacter sp.]|nr:glycosyltransferase family 2 protein [Fibrobacter sp.]